MNLDCLARRREAQMEDGKKLIEFIGELVRKY
jgi:hypothetical protein